MFSFAETCERPQIERRKKEKWNDVSQSLVSLIESFNNAHLLIIVVRPFLAHSRANVYEKTRRAPHAGIQRRDKDARLRIPMQICKIPQETRTPTSDILVLNKVLKSRPSVARFPRGFLYTAFFALLAFSAPQKSNSPDLTRYSRETFVLHVQLSKGAERSEA